MCARLKRCVISVCGTGNARLLFVVLLDFDALLVEIDEDLIGVVVLAGIPDLDELRCDLDDDLGILVGILVVAAPEELFIQLPVI